MVNVKKIFVEGVVIKQLYILISKLSYNNCEYRLKRHYNKSLKPVWTTPTPFRIWLNIIFLVCLLLIVSPWIKGNLVQPQQEMVKVKILIEVVVIAIYRLVLITKQCSGIFYSVNKCEREHYRD